MAMVNSYYNKANGNGTTENNGHNVTRHTYLPPMRGSSLPWLDIRVFYVRVCRCHLNKSTPEVLTLNCVPLHPDTLLEVNGVRSSLHSDGVAALLKRDRVDRKSEEVTFVSTDSTKMSGSVKFEVFDKDVLLLSGVLELCSSNGFVKDESSQGDEQRWRIKCESEIVPGTSFFKGKNLKLPGSALPTIEVYIAGSFLSTPIILTKTLSSRKKHTRMGTLAAIRENEASEKGEDASSPLALQASDNMSEEDNNRVYQRTGYVDMEDGELSWFNAGVRVGVGIGLSVCLGIGIGVGVLVKTYQGTTGNFRRRLL